jgi:nucleoside 2-deoxyribosyltransferase
MTRNMKIYISHSRNFDYKKDLYEPLKASGIAKEHEVIFPHDDSDKPYPTRDLLQSKGCDLIIAEVSYPATGQGIELGWASMLEIPIVCIYKEGAKVSSSLNVITNKFLMYTDTQNIRRSVFLQRFQIITLSG